MASQPPEGVSAPEDGSLPESVTAGAHERNFGVYLHVPYCRVRCGYCDFNTYTASELRGAKRENYAGEAVHEVRLAGDVMRRVGLPERKVSTVFFGGGTPTLLPGEQLAEMLHAVRDEWGLADGAEVSIEANPDTVTPQLLETLAAAGFTRVSMGMQSAVPHVLATLDRTHEPAMVPKAVDMVKEAGLQVSLDLIYGTPGESLEDWRTSLETAIACAPDHLSAYALIVEQGTKLARQIRRGEVAQPDDDLHAAMYELADGMLQAAGYEWYEISNWARADELRSRHNLSYWTGEDWWAIGPGAHSHIGGVRWWNVKHPAAYAERIARDVSPAHQRELLTAEDQRIESIMLESRLRTGARISQLEEAGKSEVASLIAEGLIDGKAAIAGRIVPTLRGRLLSDTVVHRLLQ
ncbi:radical SAM family heme chaperone HemW [Leucobacter chinensis]|uniref:radical SAM family heme chaperone HemW n=1 Tax=Leucobacter chinensis TaxID=2851010 RepID=UPI001C21EDE5